MPVNEAKLSVLTVTDLKKVKLAAHYLWGEDVDLDDDLPLIENYAEGDMPGSLRVAVASNTNETWTATSAPPCVF